LIYYLTFSIFLIDRIIKLIVSINLNQGESIKILPFLNITYLKNSGMAFSLLTGNNQLLLYVNIAVIIILALIIKFAKVKKGPAYYAYGFILGGAASNLWDRYFYNGVMDYIDFKIWPVFNIADTAITAGAFLIIYSIIKDFRDKKTNNNVSRAA